MAASSSSVNLQGLVGEFCHAKELANSINEWRLIVTADPNRRMPSSMPSLVYGPVHLLRLFIKLPEVLGKMKMPSWKTRLLVRYFEHLLEFMEMNDQWFQEA